MDFSSNSSNGTFSTRASELLKWSVMPIFETTVTVLAALTNGFTLVTFLKSRHIWTPFNVYLINLTIANLINAIVHNPIDIINSLYPAWPFSYESCTWFNYMKYVVGAAMCNSHLLITVDRLWAVMLPISYRGSRSVKTSALVCGIMWVYVHIFVLPGLIADAMYYRMPLKSNKCFINIVPQPIWQLVVQMVLFNGPLLIILVSYPVILWKMLRRRRIAASMTTRNPTVAGNVIAVENLDSVMIGSSHERSAEGGRIPGRLSSGFLVLTLLTLSVLICWTPNMTFYTITIFTPLNHWTLYQVVVSLFSLESVLDPIWFTVTIKELRDGQLSLLRSLTKFAYF